MTFKDLSFRKKLEHIWEYYKLHIVGVLIVLGCIAYTVSWYTSQVEPIINVVLLNCPSTEESVQEGFSSFFSEQGYALYDEMAAINMNAYLSGDMDVQTQYETSEALYAVLAVGKQDLFIGAGEFCLKYAQKGLFCDLTTLLPEELLAQHSDELVYADDNGETAAYPCAISFSENDWLTEFGNFRSCYVAVPYHGENPEVTVEFLQYLLAEQYDN